MEMINNISGVYLVVDPSVHRSVLLEKTGQALDGGVGILQIWNHWPEEVNEIDKAVLINELLELAGAYDVPVLINDEWELLKTTEMDGVHFDSIPDDYGRIKSEVERDFIAGITCSNDLETVKWADENGFDYISFCAMFPSPSVDSCEIVRPETVQKAREITDIPLFLSGGITPETIGELGDLDFDGVAVISGILNSEEPRKKAKEYVKAVGSMQQQ